MSWPVTAARADRRAQRWRLIASNEQHRSPQKRMNSRLPQKLQQFNSLLCGPPHWKLSGHLVAMPERKRGFLQVSVAHSRAEAECQLSALRRCSHSTTETTGPAASCQTPWEFVQTIPFRTALFPNPDATSLFPEHSPRTAAAALPARTGVSQG